MVGCVEDQVALVTGGGSGIGRAAALAFSNEGAAVVVADISVDAGNETVQILRERGGEAIFFRADVTKATDVDALVKAAVQRYDKLDCAFNNAGIQGALGTVADCTEENWDRVLNTDLKGVWLSMKYEVGHMLRQHKGAIVNMSSMFGVMGTQGFPAYVASKHGVAGLTKAAALEYARAGIRVNAVCPAWIETQLFQRVTRGDPEVISRRQNVVPIGRIGTAEEVAQAVVWLCSDAASFTTGHLMMIDGGLFAGIGNQL
jgi:NAD(P)-dependent dehydrogenase (short-subunit alcohol dehydrogenase family)